MGFWEMKHRMRLTCVTQMALYKHVHHGNHESCGEDASYLTLSVRYIVLLAKWNALSVKTFWY